MSGTAAGINLTSAVRLFPCAFTVMEPIFVMGAGGLLDWLIPLHNICHVVCCICVCCIDYLMLRFGLSSCCVVYVTSCFCLLALLCCVFVCYNQHHLVSSIGCVAFLFVAFNTICQVPFVTVVTLCFSSHNKESLFPTKLAMMGRLVGAEGFSRFCKKNRTCTMHQTTSIHDKCPQSKTCHTQPP